MTGLRLYPTWFWITVIIFIPAICVLQAKSAQGYAILVALILSLVRSSYLHPLSSNNLPYLRWLKTAPYSRGKMLPHGSVFPGIADLGVFLIFCMPALLPDVLQPETYFVILTAAAALGYILPTLVFLFRVGPVWLGYVLFGYLFTILRPVYNPAVASSTPLMMLFIIVGLGIAVLGQWIIMKRYPWGNIDFEQEAGRGRLDKAYGQSDLLNLGEPYASLSPRMGFRPVRLVHQFGVSLLCGLLMFLFGDLVRNLAHFPTAIIFIGAIGLRYYFYFSNKKLGGFLNGIRFLWQDLKRGRWTRNALLTIVILAAIATAEIYLLRRLSPKWSLIITPVATALTVLAVYLAPPSRRQWDLIGKWQLRMEPVAHFAKSRIETLRLQRS